MLGLLGAHVERSANQLVWSSDERSMGERRRRRLGHAEVDDLGYGHAVDDRDQNI